MTDKDEPITQEQMDEFLMGAQYCESEQIVVPVGQEVRVIIPIPNARSGNAR